MTRIFYIIFFSVLFSSCTSLKHNKKITVIQSARQPQLSSPVFFPTDSSLFSPDGNRLILWSNRTARIVNALDSSLPAIKHIYASDVILSAGFSGAEIDSKFLIRTSKQVSLYDSKSGQKITDLTPTGDASISAFTSAEFSANGKSVITSNCSNTVTLWDATTGQPTSSVSADSNKECITWASIARNLDVLTLNDKGALKIWQAKTQKFQPLDGKFVAARFSPVLGMIAAIKEDGKIVTWDYFKNDIGIFDAHMQSKPMSLSFSPTGDMIAIGALLGEISVIDLRTNQITFNSTTHQGGIRQLGFSPSPGQSGLKFAALSEDQTVSISDTEQGVLVLRSTNEPWFLNGVLSSDGTLMTSHEDKMVRLWHISDGQRPVFSLDAGVTKPGPIAFTSDGHTMLVAVGNELRLINLFKSREPVLLVGHQRPITHVAVSKNGKCMASADEGRGIQIWAKDGTKRQSFAVREKFPVGLALHADCSYLMVLTKNDVESWDLKSTQASLVSRVTMPKLTFSSLQQTADGQHFVATTIDKKSKVYSIDSTIGKPIEIDPAAFQGVATYQTEQGEVYETARLQNSRKAKATASFTNRRLFGPGWLSSSVQGDRILLTSRDQAVLVSLTTGKIINRYVLAELPPVPRPDETLHSTEIASAPSERTYLPKKERKQKNLGRRTIRKKLTKLP